MFIDGAFFIGVPEAFAADCGLEEGAVLSEEEVAALAAAGDVARAYRRAVRYLRPRPRSRRELAQRLGRYGYGAPVVDAVVERLSSQGLLDDDAFAAAWIRDRVALKPKGRRVLRLELAARGVAPERVEAALAANLPDTEEALARRALTPRREVWRAKGERRGRRAAFAFLIRRGFDADLARRLADEIFSAEAP